MLSTTWHIAQSLTPPYPALIIGSDVNIEAHVSTELD
jgi:hypothetical protein